MPEGADGWYADWWNNGERGSPAWESYELNEVIPAIQARFPILPQRRYHAIAGISMGGLGAAYVGSRLPGFFGSVASLSGFVDPQYFAVIADPATGFLSNAQQNGDNNWDPVYGPPDGFYATGHNPTELAMNLEQSRVFVSTGNGAPSSAELSQYNANTAALACVNPAGGACYTGDWATEGQIIQPMSQHYEQALAAAGDDVTYQVQPGGHDDPHFRQELGAMLAWGLFKPVVSSPADWVDKTVATSGQLWDIGYRFARPPSAGRPVPAGGQLALDQLSRIGGHDHDRWRLRDPRRHAGHGPGAAAQLQAKAAMKLLAQDVPLERLAPRPFAVTVSGLRSSCPRTSRRTAARSSGPRWRAERAVDPGGHRSRRDRRSQQLQQVAGNRNGVMVAGRIGSPAGRPLTTLGSRGPRLTRAPIAANPPFAAPAYPGGLVRTAGAIGSIA